MSSESLWLQFSVNRPEEIAPQTLKWSQSLKAGDLVFLKGPMGAGKTTFVGILVAQLNPSHKDQNVASPTYALHHRYQGQSLLIDHWDLYRLDNQDQLESSGFWDLLQDQTLTLIEWPEKVLTRFWPKDRRAFQVDIQLGEQIGNRQITIKQLW